jgi:hypothetical protein
MMNSLKPAYPLHPRLSQSTQQCFGVLARVDLADCLGYASLFVNHVSDAPRVLCPGVVCGAVSHAYPAIRIAQKAEREVELLRERAVFGLRVKAHPEHFRSFFLVLLDSVTESNPFSRSAGRVRLGVEPEHDLAAAQICKSHLFSSVRQRCKIRRNVAYVQHLSPPFLTGRDDIPVAAQIQTCLDRELHNE